MKACPHFEELLLERAAGPLAPEDEARVVAHLAQCPPCRSEAAAAEEVVQLVALPPPSPAEVAALATLPDTTRAAWRHAERRRAWLSRGAAGLLAVAAAALLLVWAAGALHVPRQAAGTPPAEDEASVLAAWALADPLADTWAEAELWDVEGEDNEFEAEYLNPGEEP